jgi:hypothetical protein
MSKLKCLIAIFVIFLSISTVVHALEQAGVTIGLTGMESNGISVYVGISPNTNECLYSGVYFLDEAEVNMALSVALAAKLASRTVRIIFSQPGGNGTQCFGQGIYVE